MLKQSASGPPLAKRCLIVTPTSLTVCWLRGRSRLNTVVVQRNWFKEVKKWLGLERMRAIVVCDDDKEAVASKIRHFKSSGARERGFAFRFCDDRDVRGCRAGVDHLVRTSAHSRRRTE